MHYFENKEHYHLVSQAEDLTASCFVIKGYCLGWPLYRNDLLSYLSDTYGNDDIFIESDINTHQRITISVREYIAKLLAGVKTMGNWSWQPHLTHAKDLQNSFFLPPGIMLNAIEDSLVGELVICPWLLMSAPETVTSMHQDMLSVNGVVGQLQGIKEFTLVAPEYQLQEGHFYSQQELEAMQIPYHHVVLKAGDFLYFPMRWWHQAKTIECSATFIHSTVNQHNIIPFLNDSVSKMPAYIQRIQVAAKKRSYFGNKINWLSNGFRVLE